MKIGGVELQDDHARSDQTSGSDHTCEAIRLFQPFIQAARTMNDPLIPPTTAPHLVPMMHRMRLLAKG